MHGLGPIKFEMILCETMQAQYRQKLWRSEGNISHETEEKENELSPLNVSSHTCSSETFSANKQDAGDKKMKLYGI